MIPIRVFCFLLISHFLQLVLAAKCPTSFLCGNLGYIKFPFTTSKRPDCGILAIHGCDHTEPAAKKTIQIESPFNVVKVHHHTIVIVDENLHKKLQNKCCEAFRKNITLPPISPLASFEIEDNITMFRCNHPLNFSDPKHSCHHKNCLGYNIYYSVPNTEKSESLGCPSSLKSCSMIQLSSTDITDTNDPFTFLTSEISIHVHLSDDCEECSKGRGQCQLDSSGNFYCSKVTAAERWALKLGLGIGLPTIVIGLLIGWLYKRKRASLNVQLQTRNTDNNSNLEQESSSTIYFGVPVFSYKELLETTNNFNANRKLGDGGSGTVYYGKLRYGREVAIKRLYDHNYKRVQQFMNEVKILTCLRHKNLVSLYGCTSLHSNELLLVYEYIPNGTIACHLHGNLANLGLLSWPIRMNIAIETASALAYLHASDIIHRDVKTNNILLDNKYSVKVADFGLSRLFSNDVSHVSTAPQGTRGYIDPEYFQCHQLTSKSDVYNFGVILIELISSMPPVDMTRHKDEINLAFLAMKMIRNDTISELVDPSLGFHSNNDVKRTIISVATLAFRCLQWENELRPSMDEVLEVLKRIESGKDELGDLTKANVHKAGINSSNINVMPASNSLDCDVVGLLKDAKSMPSPITVTDNWESKCTTPNVSC